MKTILTHRATHFVFILVLIVFAAYPYLGYSERQTNNTIRTIGSLGVTLFPEPPSNGSEEVKLKYEGYGFLDVSGWSIENEFGSVYVFSSYILDNGDVVRICADKTVGDCDLEWSGGEMWANGSGALHIYDGTGGLIGTMNYAGLSESDSKYTNFEIHGVMLTKKDSIRVCHSVNGKEYSSPNGNPANIVKGNGGHSQHIDYDIIPPFFYNIDGTIGYYQGLNWEAGQDQYMSECVAQ